MPARGTPTSVAGVMGAGSDDGRLELDDDGRVLDDGPPHPAPDVLADPLRPKGSGPLASYLAGSWVARRRPAVTRIVAGGTALVALAVTVSVARGEPTAPDLDARVTGIALVTEADGPGADGVLVGTYRVTPADPRTTVTVDGVVGPGIRASGSRGRAGGDGDDRAVAALPDCADPRSLDGPASGYALDTTRTGPGGRAVRERIPVPGGIVDWGSAVRRACWAAAGRDLVPVSLATRVAADGRRVTLDVGLRNGMGRDVEVHAVDVADVATLDAADAGVVATGATRTLRVRVPVTDCARADGAPGSMAARSGVPASLPWAVGPVGDAPVAVVAVPLTPAQVAAAARAVRAACGSGPSLVVRVLDARPAPRDQVASDLSGAALVVRLDLGSDATRLVLGEDTTGLTADARVAFPQQQVSLRDRRASVALTWNAPCPPTGSPPPALPVLLVAEGRRYTRAVSLSGDRLARAYARACAVSLAELRSRGWQVAGSG